MTIDAPREMKPFHCRNHDCHATLGITNGFQLVCGENAIFTLRVTITCARCGQARMWRPLLGAGAPTTPQLQGGFSPFNPQDKPQEQPIPAPIPAPKVVDMLQSE